jgi:hypothetical protein
MNHPNLPGLRRAAEIAMLFAVERPSSIASNLLSRIEAALSEAEALEQSPASDDGWKGIESAPKDGTRILAWCPHGQYVVFWPDAHDHEVDWWHVTDNKNGPYPLRGGSPTHWRPLPPSPAKEGE